MISFPLAESFEALGRLLKKKERKKPWTNS